MSDMTPVREDAEAFCGHCEWVHECWSINLALYECITTGNPLWQDQGFRNSPEGLFLKHHMKISSEYTLLQIAKLHDRRTMSGRSNLVIGYFTRQDIWSEEELCRLKRITASLDAFYRDHIRDVRCWVLAHNDLETYRHNTLLGEFSEEEGEEYLSGLAKLAGMVRHNLNPPVRGRMKHSTSARKGRSEVNSGD